MQIKEAIRHIVEGRDLSEDQAAAIMRQIMEGKATAAQIGALLTGLRMKGETVAEITGCARVMREKARTLDLGLTELVDTCGTGGDQAHTFNISTAAAFVAAGAGVKIAKHGNRSVSSSCGSADLLEALGININLDPGAVREAINRIGIGFLYAPQFHQAMRYVAAPRQEIGIRSIFNILGPLTNPAGAQAQLLGVFKEELVMVVAEVLHNLGSRRALVVHGRDGLDEISLSAPTLIAELGSWGIRYYEIRPQDLGLSPCSHEDIRGGGKTKNVQIFLDVLSGKPGPARDIVLLNAAAAIVVGEKANDLGEGLDRARRSIDEGAAYQKLEALRDFSQSFIHHDTG